MKKILITGGAGYIGSHLLIELAKAGYEFIIFDNFSNASSQVLSRIEKLSGKKFYLFLLGDYDIHDGIGVGYSVLDVIKAFEKASGKIIPYKIVGHRAGDIAKYYADATYAKEILGWEAEKSLEQMRIGIVGIGNFKTPTDIINKKGFV